MTKTQAKERIQKLRKLIDKYRYEYHVLDKSMISGDALDSLKKELFDLEAEYPDLVTKDSPTQRVAGKPLKGFKKVVHPGRMLSLVDVFSEDDFRDWKERLDGALGKIYTESFYCDLKMDGLAIELTYKNGLLVSATTRGDGEIGEDVTQNVKTVDAVPLRLRGSDFSDVLYVRGEAYLTKKEFSRINRDAKEKGNKEHANPRNLAAGTIRQLDPKVTAGRKLSFFAYSTVGTEGEHGNGFDTKNDEYYQLRQWGIPTNPNGVVVKDIGGILRFHKKWYARRDKEDYEFDGIVVSVNDNKTYRKAGIVGKAPRGAIAFKFPARQTQTIVEDIQVQVGRTGVLTPVAHLKPVNIGGTTVTRATLHNMDEIKRLVVKIGDTVIVGRAGDVIPEVIKVLKALRPKNAKEFHMPKRCPVCGGAVKKEPGKVAYRCVNKDCPARRRQDIYHFTSRKAFNIDGVGPKIIDQLMDAGLVQDAADLFSLKTGDLLNLDRFAETSSRNVIKAIKERSTISLHRFIYALGIPNVGEETARTLAERFHTFEKLRDATEEELQDLHDIGEVVADSIIEWFRRPYHKKLLNKFEKAGLHVTAEKIHQGRLSGKTLVITGTLESLGREEVKEVIHRAGGRVSGSISKETDFVVVGESPGGTKFNAAKKLGVKIIDEKTLLGLLKD